MKKEYELIYFARLRGDTQNVGIMNQTSFRAARIRCRELRKYGRFVKANVRVKFKGAK